MATQLRVGTKRLEVQTLQVAQELVLLTTWHLYGWGEDRPLPKRGQKIAVIDKHGRNGFLQIEVDVARRTRAGSIAILAVRKRRDTMRDPEL